MVLSTVSANQIGARGKKFQFENLPEQLSINSRVGTLFIVNQSMDRENFMVTVENSALRDSKNSFI